MLFSGSCKFYGLSRSDKGRSARLHKQSFLPKVFGSSQTNHSPNREAQMKKLPASMGKVTDALPAALNHERRE